MTLSEADKIRANLGKFLEIANGNLMIFFSANIPESLLPFPRESIEEALRIIIEHFKKQGNQEAIETIQDVFHLLDFYVPDSQAVKHLEKNFADGNYINKIGPKLIERQNKQLECLSINFD